MNVHGRPRSLLTFGLYLLLLLPPVFASPAAAQQVSVLDTPALRSAGATAAAMLAITRAGRRLVAVGERGVVLLSDDDGRAWRQAKRVPVSVSLAAVQFVTPETGWAAGHLGVILRSDDGGETWVRQLDGVRAAELALDDAERRVREAPRVTSALTQALVAAKRLAADGPDKPFLGLYFRDVSHGLVVGAFNLAFKTDDGGRHWQPWMSHVDNAFGYHLYGIARVGDMLVIAGEQGTLLRSADGGQQFSALKKPYESSWFGLLTTADHAVVAFGLLGTVYRSDDRGVDWQRADSGTESSISAGAVLRNGDVALTTTSGEVLLSSDDGRSFRRLASLRMPLTGVVAADGHLILSSMRGMRDLALPPAGVAPHED